MIRYILIGLLWPGALAASQDGLWMRGIRVAPPGRWELAVESRLLSEEGWRDGSPVRMLDADGQLRQTRSLRLGAALRWQALPRHAFDLELPYIFSEHGPPFPSSGVAPTYAINDPVVRRSDGAGDLVLGWRWDAWTSQDATGLAELGLGLRVSAPTGQSPWTGEHPRVATGAGVWGSELGASLQGRRGQVFGGFQFAALATSGAPAEISTVTPYAYDWRGALLLPAGRVYVAPRLGGETVTQIGTDWYVAESARHSLGVELRQRWLSPLDVDGILLDASRVQEQVGGFWARFQFLPRFTVLAAYLATPWSGRGIAASDDGSTLLRAELLF